MALIRRAEIIPHNGKKKKQMLPLVTSWNMDDSYIIDDLLSRGGRRGARRASQHTGTRGVKRLLSALPSLPTC